MKRTEPPSVTASVSAENTAESTGSTLMNQTSQADPQGLSPAVQKHIGNLLKVSFQNLLTEPVPDRFSSLLEQLEQAEKKGK